MTSSISIPRTWTRGNYFVTTDYTLIPIQAVNDMFASVDIHWASHIPSDVMATMLRNSLCFGLFEMSNSSTCENMKFIGLARCITDRTTFLYLTDVYILPKYQGRGLEKWLIGCVDEIISEMPWLGRAMLFTSDWERSVPFYEKELDMSVMATGKKGEGVAIMSRLGPGFTRKMENYEVTVSEDVENEVGGER